VSWAPDSELVVLRFFDGAVTGGKKVPPPKRVTQSKIVAQIMYQMPSGAPRGCARGRGVIRGPAAMELDPALVVARGTESIEAGSQRERDKMQIEVFYPRPASIPKSPAEPVRARGLARVDRACACWQLMPDPPANDAETPVLPWVVGQPVVRPCGLILGGVTPAVRAG
jgi:hypothetical protein